MSVIDKAEQKVRKEILSRQDRFLTKTIIQDLLSKCNAAEKDTLKAVVPCTIQKMLSAGEIEKAGGNDYDTRWYCVAGNECIKAYLESIARTSIRRHRDEFKEYDIEKDTALIGDVFYDPRKRKSAIMSVIEEMLSSGELHLEDKDAWFKVYIPILKKIRRGLEGKVKNLVDELISSQRKKEFSPDWLYSETYLRILKEYESNQIATERLIDDRDYIDKMISEHLRRRLHREYTLSCDGDRWTRSPMMIEVDCEPRLIVGRIVEDCIKETKAIFGFESLYEEVLKKWIENPYYCRYDGYSEYACIDDVLNKMLRAGEIIKIDSDQYYLHRRP